MVMDISAVARMIAALAFVLGLIGVAAVLARRYAPGALFRLQPNSERRLKVVESLILDPARRLVLVRFDDQERLILLGEGRMLADVPPRPDAVVETSPALLGDA
jgi:flagellar protein FliO/FliZ